MSDHADDADLDDIDDLGYAEAVVELDGILEAIEDDAIDIDQLSRQVRRAAALIRLCQSRIAGARIEVERVVADLAVGLDTTSSTPIGDTEHDEDDPDGEDRPDHEDGDER